MSTYRKSGCIPCWNRLVVGLLFKVAGFFSSITVVKSFVVDFFWEGLGDQSLDSSFPPFLARILDFNRIKDKERKVGGNREVVVGF